MALIHAATLSPSKAELIGAWLPTRPWAPEGGSEPELVGSFRFDDPAGEVGLETHLVRLGSQVLQVPLTYRAAPMEGADDALVGTTDHSALGSRWVYDGCSDPVYVQMAAVATLTGAGQAAEVLVGADGAWTWTPSVRLTFRGSVAGRVRVADWHGPVEEDGWAAYRSPLAELRIARRPAAPAHLDGCAMLGTWDGQREPVVLATAAVHTS